MRSPLSRRSALVGGSVLATSSLQLPLLAAIAASSDAPAIALSDGTSMPAIGYGTCCRASAKGPPLIKSTLEYLAQGGRLIDTAQMYGNEAELGEAIKASAAPRSSLWITDKVNTGPPEYSRYGDGPITSRAATVASVKASLSALGTDYIDLMHIHGTWNVDADQQIDVWRGLIDARDMGLVRRIGVSNFDRREIEALEKATGVRPCVNQLEYHPWVPDETVKLVKWCQARKIAVTAYGSLGGSRNKAGEVDPSQSTNVATVAAAHQCSNAQVLLRWALLQGVAVIPGATSAEHIRENLRVPSFELTAAERRLLASAKPTAFKRWRNLSDEVQACQKGACV